MKESYGCEEYLFIYYFCVYMSVNLFESMVTGKGHELIMKKGSYEICVLYRVKVLDIFPC